MSDSGGLRLFERNEKHKMGMMGISKLKDILLQYDKINHLLSEQI